MLTVVTWWWGDKYDSSYVIKVANGFRRYLTTPHRFLCITDKKDVRLSGVEMRPIIDTELLKVPGCFARLRMFDPEWQMANGIDDRLVCVDLDVVVTEQLDRLFDREETFVILQGANSFNPCPYNGSLWMLKAGCHREIWDDFSLEAASKIKFHEFPDDQGWFWHKMPGAAGWFVALSGIWSFRKRGWPQYDRLPSNARLVCFPGSNDPSKYKNLPWIQKYWC